MLKKSFTICLAFIYLFLTTGVEAKSMYCFGVLQKTTIGLSLNTPPLVCGMMGKKHNCCKTVTHAFKVNDAHYLVKVNFNKAPAVSNLALPPLPIYYKSNLVAWQFAVVTYYNPPQRHYLPIYTRCRNLRI